VVMMMMMISEVCVSLWQRDNYSRK